MRRRHLVVWMSVAAVAATPLALGAASLRSQTVEAWDAYVRATEARMAREFERRDGFLAADVGPGSKLDRVTLAGGAVDVVPVSTTGADARTIAVPEGLIHHWRGVVFIPNTSVDRILARVAHPADEDTAQEDVMEARVLGRGHESLRMYLRLQRRQIVTVVYNTEHDVRYRRHGTGRASSRSVATRIAEVAEPGTPGEYERPPGDDRGFLWRLNSYWRYEEVDGGVLVECESLSLSRTVPSLVRGVVRPIIDQVARGSMERTLLAMRARLSGVPFRGE